MKFVGRISILLATLLRFQITTATIIHRPLDVLSIAGSKVVFRCTTNANYNLTWWYVPVGSDPRVLEESIENGISVTVIESRNSFLSIENVTAGHVGTYYCSERNDSVSDLAELTVLEKRPDCYHSEYLSETEISCNVSMSGRAIPEILCKGGPDWVSSQSVFIASDRNLSLEYFPAYLSTKARFFSARETVFECLMFLPSQLAPMIPFSMSIGYDRDESGDADGYAAEASGDASTLDVLTVSATESSLTFARRNNNQHSSLVIIGVVSAVISVIILTCIVVVIYKCYTRKSRESTKFIAVPLNSFRV